MPFDSKDFLKLAEQLYGDQSYKHVREAALRTSISRVYYAIFLFMRELVRAKLSGTWLIDPFSKVSESGLIHSCIKRIIGRANRYMEEMYGKLFRMRKESDYDLDATIKFKDVEEAIGMAKKIIDLSERLYDSIEAQKISDIVINYYGRLARKRTE